MKLFIEQKITDTFLLFDRLNFAFTGAAIWQSENENYIFF
jgi:hypothetical protein